MAARSALGYRAPPSARTLPSCQSRIHSMLAAADTARTNGRHPCLSNHLPAFEILRSMGNLGVRISYSHLRRHVPVLVSASPWPAPLTGT